MKKTINIVMLGLSLLLSNVYATTLDNNAQIDNKTLDQIIKRLEQTGKLDDAINRAIERKVKAQKEEQMKAELKQEKLNQKNAQLIKGLTHGDHYLGDETAKYSIVVYEDLECPYCKMFADIPLNVQAGLKDVNVVSRANPLSFHMPEAAKEAVLAECIANELGNDGYFTFTRSVFKSTKGNGAGLPLVSSTYVFNGNDKEQDKYKSLKDDEKSLFALAKQIGVKDINATYACYINKETSLKLQNLLNSSVSYGITGTPTTVLKNNNTGKGEMIYGVVQEAEYLQKVQDFIKNNP